MGCCSSNLKKDLQFITYKDCKPFIPPITFGKVVKVYDGDTITIASKLPNNSQVYRFSVRLSGIDCPEIKTKDKKEKELAIQARDYLSRLIMNQYVYLENVKTEKYGRMLADVIYKDMNVSDYLISLKLAVPYKGGKKTDITWHTYYMPDFRNGKTVKI
jgi:micrococcal nuclease